METSLTGRAFYGECVMKKLVLLPFAAACLGVPALAHDDHEMGGDFSGTYAGSYTCVDGEHGFYLDLMVTDESDDGWAVDGTLGFFPTLAGMEGRAGMVAGSFDVSGTVTKVDEDGDMVIELQPGDWLVKPDSYGAAALAGVVTTSETGAWQIIGKPVVPGVPEACDALIATQFLPLAE